MNEHIIIGYLGKDPEVRFTQSGKAVTTLSVGCNRSYVDRNGERQHGLLLDMGLGKTVITLTAINELMTGCL